VSPDRLNASLLLIDVPGPWYHIPRPGAAVCSSDFGTDLHAETVIRAVFLSGLDALP
jgi:hypothetical protein